ncbi:MAG: 30S ribosome-binding factor RbfA [Caldimicrobium sp.]|nr:30S ribosome-binding factor RbfA [Caldimicrobium sp.]MCX7613246.1 30S ribosome-binding factor RbfA [Caldimicrobium sp.]MDW8182071.1 30S ribosome-binding factor RbfA [Caldimicrobium sp.]
MTRRSEKVASLLKVALSEIIMHELNNPIFKNFISITDIKIGGDLKRATIFFRVFSADPKEVEAALNQSKGYIKKLLSERIILKFMPDIEFKIDTSEEEEKRLLELLDRVRKEK